MRRSIVLCCLLMAFAVLIQPASAAQQLYFSSNDGTNSSLVERWEIAPLPQYKETITHPDLSGAYGLAVGPDGDLYIGSLFNSKIIRHDSTTHTSSVAVSTGLEWTNGLAFGNDGNLYASSYNASQIRKFDADGNSLGTLIGGIATPAGLAFGGPNNNLYVSSIGTFGTVSDSHIYEINPANGQIVRTFSTGSELNDPYGLTIGPDGNLYVASWSTNTVLRYNTSNGAYDSSFVLGASTLKNPCDVKFDADGIMYVSDYIGKSILRFGSDGSYLGAFVVSLNQNPTYIAITPVPEPAGILALFAGIIGSAGVVKRKRR